MRQIDFFRDSPGMFARYLASERASRDYCNEVVDGSGRLQYLDSIRSVSGLGLGRDLFELTTEEITEDQYLRFLHQEQEHA